MLVLLRSRRKRKEEAAERMGLTGDWGQRKEDGRPGTVGKRMGGVPGTAGNRIEGRPGIERSRAEDMSGTAGNRIDGRPETAGNRVDGGPRTTRNRAEDMSGTAGNRIDGRPGTAGNRVDGGPRTTRNRAEDMPGTAGNGKKAYLPEPDGAVVGRVGGRSGRMRRWPVEPCALAAAVLLCALAVAFPQKLAEAAGQGGVAMEYEAALFRTDSVMRIDIRMEGDAWEEMLAGAMAEEY